MKLEYIIVAIFVLIIIIFVGYAFSHKLKIEYWISSLALIVSIAFGGISWITSHKANKLQTEVYNLTKEAKDFEIRKGEILLMSLLGRYFAIQINCWELDGKMRTDEVNTKQYIYELKQLEQDINNLAINPFYIEVLKKYPELNLLWISLRRTIIEREFDQKMAVNPQLFDKFYDLYFKIKHEISDKDMLQNQFYIETDKAAHHLKTEIPKIQMNK